MTLQASGAISASDINTELQQSATAQISINDSRIRAAATTYTGQVSFSSLYGKDYYSAFANKITGVYPDIGAERYTYTDGPVEDSTGNLYYFSYDSYMTHVVKADALGQIIWQKKFGSGGNAIAISPADEIYISDNFYQLIKLDTNGNITWQREFTDGIDSVDALATDSSGNIYLMSNAIVNVYNYRGVWIYKLNSAGTVQWSKKIQWPNTSDGLQYPVMSVSATGDIVISAASYYTYYIYLIKLNSAGTVQWSQVTQGTSGSILATGIQQDSSGNIMIVGTDNNLPFLTKLNSSGATQWTRSLTTLAPTGFNGGYGGFIPLSIDSSDNVYFTTQFSTKADETQFCYSVFKYNNSGTLQYYNRITMDTNAPGYNFYNLPPQAFGPRMRISRDSSRLNIIGVTWRSGSAYNNVQLRIPSNGTTIANTAMSWGGNTAVSTGSGFTATTGTLYSWTSNAGLTVSAFTSSPTTPTNTSTAGALVVRRNALN